jgi:O-antigen/teichoic acid export membrane protein
MLTTRLKNLHKDSLVRNSFYLMLATVVVSGFGFLFWVLAAHLFSPEEVGLATALIATMNLISILSLFGINTVFVRFLSKSTKQNADISTGIAIVGIVSFLFGLIFVLFVDFFSPKLDFIQHSFVAPAFIIFCIFAAINQLFESIFIALRSTKYTLISNSLSSSLKMLFPLAFIGYGAAGVFCAAAVAQVVSFIFALVVLIKKFDYKPLFLINKSLFADTWKYSSINYVAAIFNLLPISALPIIITNHLSPQDTAYFYISMMLGNLLYVVPWSASRSLFAEGAHAEHSVAVQLKKVIRLNLILLLPGIIFVLLFGKPLLSIFGKSYATGSAHFVWLVAIAGIPLAINSTFGALLQIKKAPHALVISNIFYGTTLIGLSYLFLPLGLNGIGYAWILGNSAAALVSGISYFLTKSHPSLK